MYLSKYVLHAMHRPDLIPGDKLACLWIRGLLWSYPQCVPSLPRFQWSARVRSPSGHARVNGSIADAVSPTQDIPNTYLM